MRVLGSTVSGKSICSTFPSSGCAMRWGLFSMKEARLLGESRNTGSPGLPSTPGMIPAEVLKRDSMSTFSWSSPVSQSREDEDVSAAEVRDKRPARESVASFGLLYNVEEVVCLPNVGREDCSRPVTWLFETSLDVSSFLSCMEVPVTV